MAADPEAQSVRKITSVSTSTILKVVAVFLALYVLFVIRDIILLLVISAILASALNPLVEWLYRRMHFPRGLTVVLVYVIFIGLAVLIFSLLIPTLIEEFGGLGASIQQVRNTMDIKGSVVTDTLERFGLSNFLQSLGTTLSGFAANIFQTTLGVFSGIFDIITVLVISFYLVSQQDGLKDFIKSLAPAAYHDRIANVVVKSQKKLGQWMLGQLALMFSIFLMMFIALSILHVKYALTLSLLAGLLEIVPYLGPIISTVPGVFVALIQSPTLALIVLVVYWAVQQLEGYLLVPRIIGKSIDANPLVVLIALLIGFKIAGIVGILISAPIVAVGSLILQEFGWYGKVPGSVSKS